MFVSSFLSVMFSISLDEAYSAIKIGECRSSWYLLVRVRKHNKWFVTHKSLSQKDNVQTLQNINIEQTKTYTKSKFHMNWKKLRRKHQQSVNSSSKIAKKKAHSIKINFNLKRYTICFWKLSESKAPKEASKTNTQHSKKQGNMLTKKPYKKKYNTLQV